ncbi:amino acid permease [Corynebacterium kroppenstedtii]|nr:amino acid permease [Corynebacterium pseudokroppenstedtii]QRP15566.1 amino acid permease [Corynebacterium kroppenstedtii]
MDRGLESRHMNMIAIGGAIGTGLFVASGATIADAGPGGALVAYGAIGLMVFLLMQSLGEMATYSPVSGAFAHYARTYVSPSFGFATGWNYWFNWAITVAAELVAAALVMKFWFPSTPGWVWSAIFLALLFSLNIASVKGYGEGEFWFALIKVVAVIVFLGIGVLMIAGILGGKSPGFSNWTHGEAPFKAGFLGILNVFMIAGFSFQGTELVGVAAGESRNPDKDIPRAIRSVFIRIMLFYIGAIAVIGFLIPYTNPNLLRSDVDNISVSPFTLVFQNAGVLAAATIMNAVILTSILSAGNSGLYASTRMLYAMAKDGVAPRIFAKTSKRGVPRPALFATTAVGLLCFLTSLIGEGAAYEWLVNASGLAGFLAWMSIAWSHYRFRRAYIAQGNDPADLPYRARWFPAGPIVALVMCAVVIIGQNYQALFDWSSFSTILSSYIGLPLFIALWVGHKLSTRSHMVPLDDVDISRHHQM